MGTIITSGDLASYLRIDPTSADLDLLVELANGIVSEAAPAMVTPYSTRARAITLEVAARAYRNPEGYTSETVDDYTYRRDAGTGSAGVYLTDSERAEIVGLSGVTVRRVGSIRVTSPWDAV